MLAFRGGWLGWVLVSVTMASGGRPSPRACQSIDPPPLTAGPMSRPMERGRRSTRAVRLVTDWPPLTVWDSVPVAVRSTGERTPSVWVMCWPLESVP